MDIGNEITNTPAQKTEVLIKKALAIAGKPLFLVIFSIFFVLLQLILIPNLFLNFYRKLSGLMTKRKALKLKGTVFSSRMFKLKLSYKKIGKNLKLIHEIYKNFLWNFEVFVLAVKKLAQKSAPRILKQTRSESVFSYFKSKLLKFRFFRIRLPKLRFPNIPNFSFKKILIFLITTSVVATVFVSVLFRELILKDLPSPSALEGRKVQVSTKIRDRKGELLYTIYKDQNRTPIPLSDIPIHVRLATIAAEDSQFYEHQGFSLRGIARALITNYKERKLTGGSTITQQLVKNTLLTPEKTLVRKLKEFVLAVEVEKSFEKDKILEMYLNEVPYGGTAYGIGEAANTYFGKDAKFLTLAEAALLAGLPQSPTRYSPFGTNPQNAINRQKDVLRRMQEAGFITEEQKSEAEAEKLTFAQNRTPIKAPHFVFFIRDELEEKYGQAMVEQGGLEITTTLDLEIQNLAEEVVATEIEKLKNLNVTNAAAVIMDVKNGEILAMVGSKNFFDEAGDGNVNVATRPRQPGSSIKVVNYAYALSNGLTPASIIPDSPTTFLVEGQPPYTPKNYEGKFRGNITLRSALAESRNIPAVKILASYGVDEMLALGTKMGITTWTDPDNYGLSLTLGGGEVRLLDLARVFATIANYGKKPELTYILKAVDYRGKIVEANSCEKNKTNQNVQTAKAFEQEVQTAIASSESSQIIETASISCSGEQVLDSRVAFLITDILKDNSARAPSFGTNSLLVVNNHPEVAAKTGTSNDLRDNLAIGYNQDYVVAVWVGNNDNSEMSRISSGVTGATPIFNKIMSALLANESNHDWTEPEGLVKVAICPYTGTLACDGCQNREEWFLKENVPDRRCSPEWFKKDQEGEENGKKDNEKVSPGPTNIPNQYFEDLLKDQMKRIKKRFSG